MSEEQNKNTESVENNGAEKASVETPKKKGGKGLGIVLIGFFSLFAYVSCSIVGQMKEGLDMIDDAKKFAQDNPEMVLDANVSPAQLAQQGYFKELMGAQFVDQCRAEVFNNEALKYTSDQRKAEAVTDCVLAKATQATNTNSMHR